eukprot:CAMPEP_0201587088 /NCGR_PEP_ID=MMETSP0190_2-20130828/139823_1 /ASSEMBLY_ACC=CAM_ASM_000263 /TAXON_ID=37353 /ORGANISM="Rosalina sp." /LENGTH=416 /DNA_ID=CAMNT_0048036385 /DNA_START=16 /DNA_END=1266 /DNA_ORIENTATION=-
MTDITPLVKSTTGKPVETTANEDTQSFHEANQYLTTQKKRNYLLAGILILVIIALAVGLTLYFVLSSEDDSSSDNPLLTQNWPVTASTWPWTQPIETSWTQLMDNDDSLDAVQRGCEWCEQNPAGCDFSVGFGGSPDTNGETKLDALIMYGPTHDSGSVASMRNIKNAIGVARYVMHYTVHSMLVGDAATDFAIMMGFENSSLNGSVSWNIYQEYLANDCTPNGVKNMVNVSQCPPYEPIPLNETRDMIDGDYTNDIDVQNEYEDDMDWSKMGHDTIGVIAIDSKGYMSIGTSTNGATNKVPGRVGDSPIPGSGGYVEQGIGGCVGTGNGDIMMRFAPCKAAVMYMKHGMSVGDGCRAAMDEMVEYYPGLFASLVCMDADGNVDASTSGLDFPYTYRDSNVEEATVVTVPNPYAEN